MLQRFRVGMVQERTQRSEIDVEQFAKIAIAEESKVVLLYPSLLGVNTGYYSPSLTG